MSLEDIERRIRALNDDIATDPSLGRQFKLGHSYVTPQSEEPISDAREWFGQVVDTEIGPLLDEYWFDAPEKAQNARRRLMKGFEVSMPVPAAHDPHLSEIELVGRISVRNLWLLMLYASELFRQRERANVAVEQNPDDITDLVAGVPVPCR